MNSAIELNNISVNYDTVQALTDVNLKIKEKEFFGIIGPNGGGKSTLLKVILGLVTPSKGKIIIFGQALEKSAGLIGYVPQSVKFDRKFPINVFDVVMTGRLPHKIKLFYKYTTEDKKMVLHILERLDIEHLKDRQISQLSGGQLQRVLIARALAMNPRILVLDEPTASLDSKATTQIYSLLKELNKEMTIVVVTHDMSVVSSHMDEIACLNTTLHYHGKAELNQDIINKVYGCPVDLIAHGVPHRVYHHHGEEH